MNSEKTGNTSWTLADADALATANPYTFSKPSSVLVKSLKPSDLAKAIFLLNNPKGDEPGAERMWMKITSIEDNVFHGILDNDPQYIQDLSLGAEIVFNEAHIIDSSVDDPIPSSTFKWQRRCVVTNRVLEDGECVEFFYRESPHNGDDSGWRFLCGDETDEYIESNAIVVSLGAVLSCDDRMLELLDHPAPIAFEWDNNRQIFVVTASPEPD